MVFPFGKKKAVPPPPTPREYIPVDIVQRYTSQGLSEPEIIARLQSHGFRPSQIDRALRMALKEEVGRAPGPRPVGPEPMGERPLEPGPPGGREFRAGGPPRSPEMVPGMREAPRPRLPAPPTREIAVPPTRPTPEMRAMAPPREMPMGVPPERIRVPPGMGGEPVMLPSAPREGEFTFEKPSVERFEIPEAEITLEEVIEGVVAERWEDFEERLGNFEKRDIQLEQQIQDARKKIDELEGILKTKEETLSGKLDNFGDSVENIESRIGSIEKVFKEFLPELIENVKVMSELVEKVKEK